MLAKFHIIVLEKVIVVLGAVAMKNGSMMM
jgi:hypothetical protein